MCNLIKVKGYWWFGGSRDIKFDFTKFYIENYEDIRKTFKKNEGGIIELNEKIKIKKEAGSWNFLIKTPKKFKRIRVKNLKQIIRKLKKQGAKNER